MVLTAPKDIQEVEMILPLKAMVNMVRQHDVAADALKHDVVESHNEVVATKVLLLPLMRS
jgi:hypothetical protein